MFFVSQIMQLFPQVMFLGELTIFPLNCIPCRFQECCSFLFVMTLQHHLSHQWTFMAHYNSIVFLFSI